MVAPNARGYNLREAMVGVMSAKRDRTELTPAQRLS
jgi:hypothetical protein